VLVHRGSYYAPQAIKLSDGRHVTWGWLREDRSQQACERAGWAGVMSLPSEIVTWDDGVVGLRPVAELEGLRKEQFSWSDVLLGEGDSVSPASPRSDCLEILAEVILSPGAEFYIDIRFSPEGQELTRILFQMEERKAIIDRGKSSLNQEVQQEGIAAELEIEAGATLPVHIFIDRSTIEVFLNNGRTNLATRIYPERSDSRGIRFGCLRAETQVRSLEIWRLSPI
jgi:beta-fructofuranosidase